MAIKKRMTILSQGGTESATLALCRAAHPSLFYTYRHGRLYAYDGRKLDRCHDLKSVAHSGAVMSLLGNRGCLLSTVSSLVIKDRWNSQPRIIKKRSPYEVLALSDNYALMAKENSLEVMDVGKSVNQRFVFTISIDGSLRAMSVSKGRDPRSWLIYAGVGDNNAQWFDLLLPDCRVSTFSFAPAKFMASRRSLHVPHFPQCFKPPL